MAGEAQHSVQGRNARDIGRPPRRHAPLSLWLVLLAVVVAGLGLKVYWDGEARHAWARYQADLHVAEKSYYKLRDATGGGQRLFGSSPSRIEAVIGAKQPLQLIPFGQDYVAQWQDPTSHAQFEFRFDQDKGFIGRRASWSNGNVPRATPRSGLVQQAIGQAGRWISPVLGGCFTPLGLVFWLPLLIAYIRLPPAGGGCRSRSSRGPCSAHYFG